MDPRETKDAITTAIESAVECAVKRALNVSDATNRRLLTVEQAAEYLSLSTREIYNMFANRELLRVRRGKRIMIDIRDLDLWIERNKE